MLSDARTEIRQQLIDSGVEKKDLQKAMAKKEAEYGLTAIANRSKTAITDMAIDNGAAGTANPVVQ